MSEPTDEGTVPNPAAGTEDTIAADPLDPEAMEQITVASKPGGKAERPSLSVIERNRYELVDDLARHDGARVVRAKDRRLGRVVAIKELLATDEASAANFEREAWITGRLQHPSIVHVHEAGRWPSGERFFAMKLVAGRPIDRVITDAKKPDERIALLPRAIAVVDALAYAHIEGVIHRCVEPANVLCAEHGETVVIDWSLAKELADSGDDIPVTTRRIATTGSAFHAPAYMPPEQVRGDRWVIDARGDVYSLGALLYHVLSGIPPYQGRDPQSVIAAVLGGPPPSLRIRAPVAPPPLVAIVEKAMARDPQQRYASAKQMADDLKRFEAGQLVAHPSDSLGALLGAWSRRNRTAVKIAAGAVIALIAILILASRGGGRREEDAPPVAKEDAVPTTIRVATLSVQVQAARALIDADPTEALAMLTRVARADDANLVIDDLQLAAADAQSRAVAHVLVGNTRIHGLAVTADDKLVAAAGADRFVSLWKLAPEWKVVAKLAHDHPVLDVAFVDDGATLISVDSVGTVRRWNVATKTSETIRAGAGIYRRAMLAPHGEAAVVFAEFEAELWKFDGKTADRTLAGCTTAAWAPGGKKVVYNGAQQVELRDLETGEAHSTPTTAEVISLATDGESIYVGGLDGSLRSGSDTIHRHSGPVTAMVVLGDGTVISASSDHETRTPTDRRFVDGDYRIISGKRELKGHRTSIDALAVSGTGMIVSAGRDGVIRVWQSPPEAKRIAWSGGPQRPNRASVTADLREVVLGRAGPALDVHDRASGKLRSITPPPPGPESVRIEVGPNGERIARPLSVPKSAILGYETSLDGRKIATLDDTWSVVSWDVAANKAQVLGTGHRIVAISDDGSRVAAAGRDNTLRVWQFATGKVLEIANTKIVNAIALDATGGLLAAAFDDGNVGLFDTAGNQPTRVLTGPRDRLLAIRFVPSNHVVAGGEGGELRAWNLATRIMTSWKAHADAIQSILVGRNRVATIGADHALQSFAFADYQQGKTIHLPPRLWHGTIILSATLLDDPTVLTIGDDRAVRFWSGTNTRIVTRHPGRVLAAARGDGLVISVDDLGDIVETPDPVPRDLAKLRTWLAAATNMQP